MDGPKSFFKWCSTPSSAPPPLASPIIEKLEVIEIDVPHDDQKVQVVQTGGKAALVKDTWDMMIQEAQNMVAKDPTVRHFVDRAIIEQPTFTAALTSLLSAHFSGGVVSLGSWHEVFLSAHNDNNIYEPGMDTITELAVQDLIAVRQRDIASDNLLVHPFLNFKGYKALQSHRIAHMLWRSGRRDLARSIQSRCSDLFGVDIHPAAVIGPGLVIDHGNGVVVGETVVIGTNSTLMHGVTLGATGKATGDRHPKIGNNVFIGCGASVIGNIRVSDNCTVGSGSIVLKPLPEGVTAVGNPARILLTTTKYEDCEIEFYI